MLSSRWRMNRLMAGHAAKLIGQQRLHHGGVCRIAFEVGCRAVALQAVRVRERFAELNLFRHSDAAVINCYVPQTSKLGRDRAQEPVVSVTGIALVVEDPAVAEMHRSQ